MQNHIIPVGVKILIFDDVLAIGKTILAATNLDKKANFEVVSAISLMETRFLMGAKNYLSRVVVCKSILQA